MTPYKAYFNPINRPRDLSRSIDLVKIYILVDLELHSSYRMLVQARRRSILVLGPWSLVLGLGPWSLVFVPMNIFSPQVRYKGWVFKNNLLLGCLSTFRVLGYLSDVCLHFGCCLPFGCLPTFRFACQPTFSIGFPRKSKEARPDDC